MNRAPMHIHIPKTGGSSFRQGLGITDPVHMNGPQLREYKGEEAWASGFKFTVVRNPFDRLVSHYFWGRVERPARGHIMASAEYVERWPTFGSWVLFHLNERSRGRRTYGSALQTDFIGGVELDYIGRFEDLEETWRTVCLGCGIEHVPLPHARKSSHDHYRTYYTDLTRRLVEEWCQDELALFGYEF